MPVKARRRSQSNGKILQSGSLDSKATFTLPIDPPGFGRERRHDLGVGVGFLEVKACMDLGKGCSIGAENLGGWQRMMIHGGCFFF